MRQMSDSSCFYQSPHWSHTCITVVFEEDKPFRVASCVVSSDLTVQCYPFSVESSETYNLLLLFFHLTWVSSRPV